MDTYKNAVRVAAHRGNCRFFPENTLVAFESALKMPVDQLEIDLHMTKDHEIIIMHDHTVNRTTNGTGRIRDLTCKEICALDAGSWKGEEFKGVKVPTFVEFLEFMKDYPDMTLNVELKDYPSDDREWALESADRAIALLEKYGWSKKIWLNSWSGEMLEYLDEKYQHAYRLHGYFPQSLMGEGMTRNPYEYLHCACLCGSREQPVRDKKDFDALLAAGVEPWVCYGNDALESYEAAINNGAMLITANDPQKTLNYLHSRGLHEL